MGVATPDYVSPTNAKLGFHDNNNGCTDDQILGNGCMSSINITRRMFNIDGEREQANWDMAAILELQSVPLVSFHKKTGRASYCKKREHVKLR